MWNYVFYCQTFFLITNAVLQPKPTVKTNPHPDVEAVFADVIRNISRVNDVLQELIHNYEHLQKIYKSQEIVESDVSSDNEIDKDFKGKRLSSTTKKSLNNDFQLATEVIWSDMDNVGSDNAKKSKHDKRIKKGRVPHIQNLQAGKEKHKNKKPKSLSESSSNDISNEKHIQTKDKVVYTDKKKHSKNKSNKKNNKVEKKHTTAEIPKTKHYKILQSFPFDKDITFNENKKKKHLEPRNYLRETNLTAQQETSTNTYAFNILKSGGKLNISIRSRGQLIEPSYTKNYNEQNTSRSGKKTALILIKNDMLDKLSASSENSSAEDEAIDKDLFKTNVLRQAYGDACLKLVIKKCYKACKSVVKLSCREYRCKSEFKNKFKRSSKTGCIKEFENIGTKNEPSIYTRQDPPKEITPEGYLEAACSDDFKTDPVLLRNATEPSKASDGDENVNLLRDRLEKACKKISRKKCEAACNYAVNESCTAFECRNGHKKKFHKNCKSQCRLSYGGSSSSNRKDSSGRSGSTSGSSSTDDSGSSYDDSSSF